MKIAVSGYCHSIYNNNNPSHFKQNNHKSIAFFLFFFPVAAWHSFVMKTGQKCCLPHQIFNQISNISVDTVLASLEWLQILRSVDGRERMKISLWDGNSKVMETDGHVQRTFDCELGQDNMTLVVLRLFSLWKEGCGIKRNYQSLFCS